MRFLTVGQVVGSPAAARGDSGLVPEWNTHFTFQTATARKLELDDRRMPRRKLGRLDVSAIGLGAPIYAEPNPDAVIPNLHRALDRGVDLVDTSDIYWHGDARGARRPRHQGPARRGRPRHASSGTSGRPAGRRRRTAGPSTSSRRARPACAVSRWTSSTSTTSTGSTRRWPIEETVGAMARLVSPGEGAPPRHLRGGAGDAAPGPRHPSHGGAPGRVLALVAPSGG